MGGHQICTKVQKNPFFKTNGISPFLKNVSVCKDAFFAPFFFVLFDERGELGFNSYASGSHFFVL